LAGYLTRTRDGRLLKSTSIVFRNPKGKAIASLCINFDLTELNIANQFLSEMCTGQNGGWEAPATPKEGPSLAGKNMKANIKEIVDEAVGQMNRPVNLAQKPEKLEALKTMHDRGLFLIRGSVDYAAEALGVSRFTIYNYLKEIRFKEIK
jgi:predicted transcriptional regulator YheO